MKSPLLTLFGLVLLCGAPGRAQEAAPPATPPADGAPTDDARMEQEAPPPAAREPSPGDDAASSETASQDGTTPADVRLEIARRALANVDSQRLFSDQDYAAEILRDIDLVSPTLPPEAAAATSVQTLRLVALATLRRADEARPLIDALLRSRPRDPHVYAAPLLASAALEDNARIVATIETASENVPGVGWSDLRGFIDRDATGALLRDLKVHHETALRARLAGALFRIGWPGDGDSGAADYLRSILLDDRLAHDDRPAAADYAASMRTPAATLSLIVGKRYDSLFAPGLDRLALLQQALEHQDRDTAAGLAAASQDPKRVLDRVRYLRGIGRDADALALLLPFTRNVRATVAASDDGMWLINEAAQALVTLGRDNEALGLMRRLAALPIESNGALIGPRINYALMLWETGRFGDSLDQALRLDREADRYANDFGKAWIASSLVCALARLNRGAEAGPQLARLRADAELNPTALMRAYLCLGQDDDAADLLVHRLESDDPNGALLSLQDYRPSQGIAQAAPLHDRFMALRERPAVRAALERVGRVLDLPLSRTYWSDF
jgi:hypothetical protein